MQLSPINYQVRQNSQLNLMFKNKSGIARTVSETLPKAGVAAVSTALTAGYAVGQYLNLKEYGKDKEAEAILSSAVTELGAEDVRETTRSVAADLYSQGEGRVARMLTNDVLKAAGVIPKSDLPENMVPVAEKIKELKTELVKLNSLQESESKSIELEKVQAQLDKNISKVKKEIRALQRQLKAFGAGSDRYDQILMDRIQAKIKALREIVPLDRTNLKEVLLAAPEEIFTPLKADNIKGKGITFRPVIPTDPEKLKDVTYKAVPLYTNARTVAEMIRIAARDGVKIELIQDAEGNYYPGVKNVWSEGGYFRLDRDSFVLQYGEISVEDPYIDKEWAKKNKYRNKDNKYVIMDCAIVAADKKTVADIMPKSYVKADGSHITHRDKSAWNGFNVHKDPNGIINAVAYNESKTFVTLEGLIETDVTMGDVEGNVYNKYKDLEKQILKNKIEANPDDPNSQKFIDLVKAGNKEAAIELLRKATVG